MTTPPIKEVYCVMSAEHNECSLSNAAFPSYDEAKKHCDFVAKHFGCVMGIYHVTYYLKSEEAQ